MWGRGPLASGAEGDHDRAAALRPRLTASYGLAQVLFGVTFDVRRGEGAALMGRNGAGKTTTLKAIMG